MNKPSAHIPQVPLTVHQRGDDPRVFYFDFADRADSFNGTDYATEFRLLAEKQGLKRWVAEESPTRVVFTAQPLCKTDGQPVRDTGGRIINLNAAAALVIPNRDEAYKVARILRRELTPEGGKDGAGPSHNLSFKVSENAITQWEKGKFPQSWREWAGDMLISATTGSEAGNARYYAPEIRPTSPYQPIAQPNEYDTVVSVNPPMAR